MGGTPRRYVLMNLRVTPFARQSWQAFAEAHGVPASALAEAIGEWMANPAEPQLSDLVRRATEISSGRYSRKPRSGGQGSGQEMGRPDV